MVRCLFVCSFVFGTISATHAQEPGAAAPQSPYKTAREKVSYNVGRNVGENIKRQGADLDKAALMQGIKDVLAGTDSPLTEEEVQKAFTDFQAELKKKEEQKATKNAEASQKFLDEHKKKEGVKATESGLQYIVLKAGDGETPGPESVVKVHYHGTLPDGKVFDSSVDRKMPATFPVNRVIKGWTEALQMMKVGSKYKLVIPPAIAYGERGAGSDIGPNQVLIFEVELLEIVKK